MKWIKNYKLIKNSKNNPVADSKLTWDVFEDQVAAFSILNRNDPGLILFYAFAFEPFENKKGLENKKGQSGKNPIGFDTIIDEAVEILNGKREIAGIDQTEAREYLLAQDRYVLVDEYQDIDDRQYRFISALTGRLEQDRDKSISIMAVGDDDQSIYGFRNANVGFIKQFQQDYEAKTFYLVENYRSSYPIIQASNARAEPLIRGLSYQCNILKKKERYMELFNLFELATNRADAWNTLWQFYIGISTGLLAVVTASTKPLSKKGAAIICLGFALFIVGNYSAFYDHYKIRTQIQTMISNFQYDKLNVTSDTTTNLPVLYNDEEKFKQLSDQIAPGNLALFGTKLFFYYYWTIAFLVFAALWFIPHYRRQ